MNRISFETEFGFKVKFVSHTTRNKSGEKVMTVDVTTYSDKDGLQHSFWFDDVRQLKVLWEVLNDYLDKTGYLRHFEEPKFSMSEEEVNVVITPGYPFDEIDEMPECFDISIALYEGEKQRRGYFWVNTRSEFFFFTSVISEYLTEIAKVGLNSPK